MSTTVVDPELHSVSGHDSTEARHTPFHGDRGRELPTGCVFMTGGPRDAFPGINCVLRRLRAVGTRHSVVHVATASDAAETRAMAARHGAHLAISERFPRPEGSNAASASAAYDLLNVLGAPFARVVWLGPEMLVRRNLDALCSPPPNGSSPLSAAAASGHGARASCLDESLSRSSARLCLGCNTAECRWEVDNGLLALTPLSSAAFAEEVVAPVRDGALSSQDAATFHPGNALLNALLYRRGLFGGAATRLPPGVVAPAAASRAGRGGTAAVLRYARSALPWRYARTNQSRPACTSNWCIEWWEACGGGAVVGGGGV